MLAYILFNKYLLNFVSKFKNKTKIHAIVYDSKFTFMILLFNNLSSAIRKIFQQTKMNLIYNKMQSYYF